MRVLGIDQSFTSTGYCILDDGMILKCGIITSDKTTDIFDRAHTIATKLQLLCEQHRPRLVGIEGLAFNMRGNATRNLAGLQFTIIVQLRQLNHQTQIVNPKIVKKFATGNGSASKDDLYNATPNLTKLFFNENGLKKSKGRPDVVDAYWIARYIYEENI